MGQRRRRPQPGQRPEPIRRSTAKSSADSRGRGEPRRDRGDSHIEDNRRPHRGGQGNGWSNDVYEDDYTDNNVLREFGAPIIVTGMIGITLKLLGVFEFVGYMVVPVISVVVLFTIISIVVNRKSIDEVTQGVGNSYRKVRGKVNPGILTKYVEWTRSLYDMVLGSENDYDADLDEYNTFTNEEDDDPFQEEEYEDELDLGDFDLGQEGDDSIDGWGDGEYEDEEYSPEMRRGEVCHDGEGNRLKVDNVVEEVKPIGAMSFQVDNDRALQVHTTYLNDKESMTKITTDGNRSLEVFGSDITVTSNGGKVEIYTNTTIDNFDSEPFTIVAGRGQDRVELNLNGVKNLIVESVKVKGKGQTFVLTTPVDQQESVGMSDLDWEGALKTAEDRHGQPPIEEEKEVDEDIRYPDISDISDMANEILGDTPQGADFDMDFMDFSEGIILEGDQD